MKSLYCKTYALADLLTQLDNLLKKHYPNLDDSKRADSIIQISNYFSQLTDNIFVCYEYPYVDRVYRNEYYHYYSSKLYDYSRDSVRFSFFDAAINDNDFREADKALYLQQHFKGFLILRPTFPYVIGRSVISPTIFTNADILIRSAKFEAAINGIKLFVNGFPHASQDSEMMVCAETTIWSIMEYFAYSYAEYKPIFPSEIHNILSKFSTERQVPSNGLTALQISYAFKQLGFGVKTYSSDPLAYGNDCINILKTYVESGIPVIAAITNANGIGHVMNVIGRPTTPNVNIADVPLKTLRNKINVGDFYDLFEEYVMIDDNHPPYRVTPLNNPAQHYTNPLWRNCKILSIIVPLYSKIYLEADSAKKLAYLALEAFDTVVVDSTYYIRTLLTSSRSFKHSIALNSTLDPDIKELVLNISLPKFVWIAEIKTVDDISRDTTSGMVLMDATEPKGSEILAFCLNNLYFSWENGALSKKITVNLQPFSSFHNLKL